MLWAIDAAMRSNLFDHVIVSTDDAEIAALAESGRCQVHARDADDGTKGTQEVARDVLTAWPEATKACVIYPCSPMLLPDDIREAHLLLMPLISYIVSVQASPLADAGCFYWGRASAFRGAAPLYDATTIAYPLPANRCIDINTMDDWATAESMFDALRRANP